MILGFMREEIAGTNKQTKWKQSIGNLGAVLEEHLEPKYSRDYSMKFNKMFSCG